MKKGRKKLALPGVTWDYLRFVREGEGRQPCEAGDEPAKQGWRPAAGTFDGWPGTAAELRVLDPCCGSGHFLVAALHHLVPVRMAEEGLSATDAVEAVLRDNLHGLEIDERCCQIAAFALAFAAWTYPDAGGYRELPEMHIACTGIGPRCSADEWVRLAEESGVPMPTVGREAIKAGLLNLHRLFSQAPTLGSLIDPAELPGDLIVADYETIQPYLTAILSAENADDELRERAIAAAGMVKAADLLASDYTLVITNVPYLGRGLQDDTLKGFADSNYREARNDLATIFIVRMLLSAGCNGTIASVAPQNWLFQPNYRRLREHLLSRHEWRLAVRLGTKAFQTPMWDFNVMLMVLSRNKPEKPHTFCGIDASDHRSAPDKASSLRGTIGDSRIDDLILMDQLNQLKNPIARIMFRRGQADQTLGEYAGCYAGLSGADINRFTTRFWEIPTTPEWRFMQNSFSEGGEVNGMCYQILWQDGKGSYYELVAEKLGEGGVGAWIRGDAAWNRDGVTVVKMQNLQCARYFGNLFGANVYVIVPNEQEHLPAIFAYARDPSFCANCRQVDQKTDIANQAILDIPFDLAHWQKVAAKKYPDGLPEPESDDPTQWVFHGHPYEAEEEAMLQVAVARLLGYRWPAELDPDMRLSERARALADECEELVKFADKDGIVCIPAVRGEDPAAERLLRLLAACDIEPESDLDLDDWLRNGFFQEHCELFHHRPFVWHVWDGRKRDGFHALVNYHKLCEGGGKGRKLLESLTYSYLGDWITRCRDEVKRGEGGAEDRLAAAVALQDRLKAILAGEPPFDLFVRWKPLHEQPIGWEPDTNDGVRINIRPFLASDLPSGRKGAGILRHKPNIKWTKDRGKEPQRPKDEYPWFWTWNGKTEDFMGGKDFDGVRHNACHYTTKTKQAARDAAGKEPS